MEVTERTIELFWEKVSISGPDDCWLWNSSCNKKGYGSFKIEGRSYIASRISWTINNGPIPKGLWVLHNCPNGDNPACVNPKHLWLGTNQDNTADRDAKGKTAKGLNNGRYTHPETTVRGEQLHLSKLTESEVLRIRWLKTQGWTYPKLAKLFRVSQHALWDVVHRKTWRHI